MHNHWRFAFEPETDEEVAAREAQRARVLAAIAALRDEVVTNNSNDYDWTRVSGYVETNYGYLPGSDVDAAEETYRIKLHQRAARARASGSMTAALAMELFHDQLVSA